MRDVKSECSSEWPNHQTYLDCNNMVKKTQQNNNDLQGAIAAVGVACCDFVI